MSRRLRRLLPAFALSTTLFGTGVAGGAWLAERDDAGAGARPGTAVTRSAGTTRAPAPAARPATTPPPTTTTAPAPAPAPPPECPPIAFRRSRAVGLPNDGRLVRGVRLPSCGPGWVTWHPVENRVPNRSWRVWGTDRLVRTLVRVLREHHEAHPDLPPVLVGDLSRTRGGPFGRRFGGLGHRSHQNGLDVDVYYQRRDRALGGPERPRDVDRRLAQELTDRFVAAGAILVFTGPALDLVGPRGIVQPLVHHDDHLHVRLPATGRQQRRLARADARRRARAGG